MFFNHGFKVGGMDKKKWGEKKERKRRMRENSKLVKNILFSFLKDIYIIFNI
jgi:hypothetical protein